MTRRDLMSENSLDNGSAAHLYDQNNGSTPQPQTPTGSSGKTRARLPPETVKAFEKTFLKSKNPPASIIQDLAQTYSLDPVKVKTWFNNRKAKEKRLQLEASVTNTPKSVPPGLLNHVLTTASGFDFSIDEPPAEFNLEMFFAMRDRIELLEAQIKAYQQNLKRVPNDDGSYNRPVKRANVPSVIVSDHMQNIQQVIMTESSSLKYVRFDESKFIHFDVSMTVDEFVAVFDEKGGTVNQVPKDPHVPHGERLVQVDFSSPETVINLLSAHIVYDLTASLIIGDKIDLIHLLVHSLCVRYDKVKGIASLTFTMIPRNPSQTKP